MEAEKTGERDFFEEMGLEVTHGQIEIGGTYPIFGMITAIIDPTPGHVVVEINHSISAHISVTESDKIELLKERSFESGIFVATVTAKEPTVEVNCKTIIFGRAQGYHA